MTDTNTAEKAKLSVIPKGHWRNKFFYDRSLLHDDGEVLGPGEVYGTHKWPSAEVAEQVALEDRAEFVASGLDMTPIKYLGPVFFPEPET